VLTVTNIHDASKLTFTWMLLLHPDLILIE